MRGVREREREERSVRALEREERRRGQDGEAGRLQLVRGVGLGKERRAQGRKEEHGRVGVSGYVCVFVLVYVRAVKRGQRPAQAPSGRGWEERRGADCT